MCLIHILCRAQNMLQVAETARLWITSQQLNEHMTERNKIKNPCITQLCICHTNQAIFFVFGLTGILQVCDVTV